MLTISANRVFEKVLIYVTFAEYVLQLPHSWGEGFTEFFALGISRIFQTYSNELLSALSHWQGLSSALLSSARAYAVD